MALDKWAAALFLAGAVAYGYAAFTYPLLPFERHQPFLPNTLPIALSVAASILSIIVLVSPSPRAPGGKPALGDVDLKDIGRDHFGQAAMLVGAMILYALALRPIGFIASTTLFLVGAGLILGERKLHVMIPIALTGGVVVWFLVERTLGIFLKPLPWFMD